LLAVAGFVALTVASALLPRSASSQTATSYAFAELGTLGGTYSVATDVNDSAQVVGMSFLPSGSVWQRDERAFYWANGVMIEIGTLGGTWSHALSINSSGDVVGRSQIPSTPNQTHAYLWNSVTRELQDLNGYLSPADAAAVELRSANHISETRVVAGECRMRDTGATHGFILDLSAVPANFTDLGSLGGSIGWADAVNVHLQAVGSSTTTANTTRGFLFNTTPPLLELASVTYARDINDAGAVVGSASALPIYRSPAGVITRLGTFGGSSGEAKSINNAETVVGAATDRKGSSCGFRWQAGGGAIQKLDSLCPGRGKSSITSGLAVSPSGRIAGKAIRGGVERACLLTPQ
jgi:probable HAF family extracellular repeat protein